jgi:adenylate cyclase
MNEGANDPILITLPKGTYAPEFEHHIPAVKPTDHDPILTEASAPPTGPAIAVLPFDNLSEDENLSFFSDGLTEEIITHLSLSLGVYVLSRKLTAGYNSATVDIKKLCNELEAHYVLQGSIRKAGHNLRVTVQLVDATHGGIIWANSYDREVTASNFFSLQDDIADHVAAAIGDTYGIVMRDIAKNFTRPTTEHMDVYQAMISFHNYFYKLSPQSHLEAREKLEKAVQTDPNYSNAFAGLGFLALDEYRFSFNKVKGRCPLLKAQEYAEKSVALNSRISIAWYVMTLISFHNGDFEQFRQNIRMSLTIAPNNSAILADSGLYLCLLGDVDKGLPLVKKAMDLNPQHPGWCKFALFHAHFIKDEYEMAQKYVHYIDTPDWFWPHVLQAINYAKLGDMKASDLASEKALKLYPQFPANTEIECAKWLKDDEVKKKFLAALRETNLYQPSIYQINDT